MTITGTNFENGATVGFGATTGISAVYSAGTLQFTIPLHELYETGAKNVTVTYGGQTSSPSTFTVTNPSSLYAGYRADSGITLNGSNVSQWNDYSGNGNHLTQTTASMQPPFNASQSTFGNKPTVGWFNLQKLNVLFATALPMPFTKFVVTRLHSTSNPYGVVSATNCQGISAGSSYGVLIGSSGAQVDEPYGYIDGGSTVAVTGKHRRPLVTSSYAFQPNFTGNTSKFFPSTNAPITAAGVANKNLTGLSINGGPGATTVTNGTELPELAVFNTALTDTNISVLNQYATYRYAADTITKSSVANMNVARAFAGACVIPDGRVVVVGGQDTAAALLRSSSVYDPGLDTWSAGPSLTAANLSTLGGTLSTVITLNDGRVFVWGDTDTGAILNISANIKTDIGPTTTNHGSKPTTTKLANGKVVIIGGSVSGTAIDIYDPVTNTFTRSSATVTSRYSHTAVLLNDGRILVMGGASSNTSCQIYDPVADTVSSAASLPTSGANPIATRLPSGDVLWMFGTNVYKYSVAGNAWSTVSNVPYNSVDLAGIAWSNPPSFADGSVLIPGTASTSVNIFNPTQSVFYTVDKRTNEYNAAAAVRLNDGRIFVTGGFITNTWASNESAIYEKLDQSTTMSNLRMSACSGERWFASTSMSITGNNLGVGATVNFGSSTNIATTFSAGIGSLGTISFTVPESEFYETGSKNVTVTYNGVTSSAMVFSVVQPTALIQDLRADRGITLNGSKVSAWSSYDVSGDSNRTVSQATASLQPTFQSADSNFNNKPSVKFTKANATRLVSGAFSTGNWAQTTYAGVIKSDQSGNGAWWLVDGLTSGTRSFVGAYNNFSASTGFFMYRGGTLETFALNTVTTASAIFTQFEGSVGGATTERIYVRSASSGTSATKGTNNGQTGLTLGDRFAAYTTDGAGSWEGAVAEWLMFNAPLTEAQRTRLGNYFSNRYGSGVMTP